jgi:hypothetical protein
MPIHRTRPTKNFTPLENCMLQDGRLTGEALGLLAWLLSHAPGWKIIIPVVMRQMRWGRDKTYRILKVLLEIGYVQREQERDSKTGSFGEMTYSVHSNTPDKHLSSELPLPGLPLPGNSKASKRTKKKSLEIPPTPQLTAQTPGEERASLNKMKPRTTQEIACSRSDTRKGACVLFAEFWNAYDPLPYMSEFAAHRVWQKLNEDDRREAYNAVAAYKTDCTVNNRKRKNAHTYLRDRVWRDFMANRAVKSVVLRPHSPEWWAWHAHLVRNGQRVSFMEHTARVGKGYSVPESWASDCGWADNRSDRDRVTFGQ